MLITSHVKIAWNGEVQSPDPIFNLCIKKSLHFKLKISLIINFLYLYDKIRLCSEDYSHSHKQSSEIVGHTEEGGTLGSHLLYTKLQLARGIPWQKCISQREQCSQLTGKGTTSFSNHRDHKENQQKPSPPSSPGVHKDTPGSSRRGLSNVCLASWQLFHVQQHQAGWVEKTGTQVEKSTQDWGQKIWHRDQTLWPDLSKALGKSISVCFLLLWSTILTKSNLERKRLIWLTHSEDRPWLR